MTSPHGTYTRYMCYGCSCEPCRAAARDYWRDRNRAIAYGRWQPCVDAEPVRQHILTLRAHNVSARQIARLAGVPYSTVYRILHGEAGYPPPTKIRAATAKAILTVSPTLDDLADGSHVPIDPYRRRLRSLFAAGWPYSRLAEHLGMNDSNLRKLLNKSKITAATARAIRDLYTRLEHTNPADHGVPAASITKARNLATRRGWQVPGAWDPEWLDLTDSQLEAELQRLAADMTDTDVSRCYRAHLAGDNTPLTVAAAHEHLRRRRTRRHTTSTEGTAA